MSKKDVQKDLFDNHAKLRKKSNMESVLSLAKTIVQTFFDAGYTAYFAGGWVRDLLLGVETDEIDIATNAPPDIISRLFPKTIPVGAAYGVVIVVFEKIQFEVTTFRKDHEYIDGRRPQQIDFSTPEKDAWRRDFTINGMFFDPLTETLIDYVGGQEDLKKKIIRAIGDPGARFAEDRLRMIRAIRFAARFAFRLEAQTRKAIIDHASTLFPSVSMERVWQEFIKMSNYPRFDYAIILMHRVGLLQTIFPQLHSISMDEIEKRVSPFPYFPFPCPTIIYLFQLFPNSKPDEMESLCQYLKTSGKDRELAVFFSHSQLFFKKPIKEPIEWVYFYAHPHSSLFLQVEAAKRMPPRRLAFMKEHDKRQHELSFHISRIQARSPLVNASHLLEFMPPGKRLGKLLKEAERISVNYDLKEPEQILALLKESPLWPDDEISHL